MTQAERAVQFLEDQMNLDSLMAIPPILYQPIIMTKAENIKIEGHGTRVDSFTKLEGGLGLTIGKGVHIASFAHINIGGGTTILEDFSAVASGGKIISGSNQVEGLSMSASAPEDMQKTKQMVTILRRFACVLTNAVVLPGLTLGEGAVLAAGAVATKSIPAWEIWGGIPARFLAFRRAGML